MREVQGLDHGSDGGASSDIVGLPDVMVQAGSHLATYFNSESGRLRIAIPFLREGIKLGQPTFLIASGEILERYIQALEQEVKPELAKARRSGLFATAPTPGRNVKEALTFWADKIAAALSGEPTIVRVVGDMACVKASFESVHQMFLFGREVSSILKQSPTVAVCQYDVREFDGPSLLEAIKTHPGVSDLGFAKFVI
jgi:MEDS: MEthanogen/methylotroph, DcmR Sensory domain